jgi:hypothetical protein
MASSGFFVILKVACTRPLWHINYGYIKTHQNSGIAVDIIYLLMKLK